MDVGLVTTLVISILSKYGVHIVKGAEIGLELVKKLGPSAVEAAKKLYDAVKKSFASDEKAKKALELYEEDPATFESALKAILKEHLEQNQALAEDLAKLVDAFKGAVPSDIAAQIIVSGSGAVATGGGVAAGEGGYAAGRDIHIARESQDKE